MTAVAAPTAPLSAAQRSPWHSPVPYLFGGLAAMLGLIAFALLILACSYWKLSGYLENNEEERDLESGDADGGDSKADAKSAAPVFEEKFLVIMAGQAKPTYLATPMSSRASSFGSTGGRSSATVADSKSEVEMEKNREAGGDQVQVGNTENTHATAGQGQVQVHVTTSSERSHEAAANDHEVP